MINEYYGVASTPTEDYIAHYGIKGMKWGVKRALSKNNDKSLAKQYQKAQKKLNKLNKKADVNAQNESYKKYKKAAKGGLGATGAMLGLAGLGTGASVVGRKIKSKAVKTRDYEKLLAAEQGIERSKNIDKAFINNKLSAENFKKMSKSNLERMAKEGAAAEAKANKALRVGDAHINKGRSLQAIAAGGAAGGLLYSGAVGAKAAAAKYRTTKKGHAKAVAKRDAWEREMNTAFAGTKYGKKKRR